MLSRKMSRGVWWSKASRRGGRRRCDVLLSNLRAPRFWPSDVVCGGGGNWEGLSAGEGRGTSSTAAPPLLSSGLASGSKSCTAPTRSSLLQSMHSWPVRVINRHDSQAWQGRSGCLSGLHSRSHLISSHLESFRCTIELTISVQTWSCARPLVRACMRACVQMFIYDWLCPLYTQSSNSLCQSPSPQLPPPCLLPVPKLRLSG